VGLAWAAVVHLAHIPPGSSWAGSSLLACGPARCLAAPAECPDATNRLSIEPDLRQPILDALATLIRNGGAELRTGLRNAQLIPCGLVTRPYSSGADIQWAAPCGGATQAG
jgi:hypothetical protein